MEGQTFCNSQLGNRTLEKLKTIGKTIEWLLNVALPPSV
jgi:hypothetical protein